LRFPRGSLMAYRRHLPAGDVLAEPGTQDITAHVPWTSLESVAAGFGWRKRSFEPLSSLLMKAGEADQFASALEGGRERHTLQLKTLLFGMGESYQAITMERTETGP
jgi:SAM-dependent MidA family methyltransferase